VEFTFTVPFTVDAVLELEDVDLFVDELVLAVTEDVSSGSSQKSPEAHQASYRR
jgi:hypothetical protein